MVIKDRKMSPAFANLEHQLSVKTVSFDHLCPRVANSAAADTLAYQSTLLTSADGGHENYSTAETEAMIKIQRLWRSCSLKIKRRRSYVSVPVCRATAHFFNLGAQCPDTVTSGSRNVIRKLLVSQGVKLSLRLAIARDTLSKLQKDATDCVENVDISTELFESVDDILQRNSQAEVLLKRFDNKMFDESLLGVVKIGMLDVVEEVMEDVEEIVTEAEQGMLETRKMVDEVSHNCT